MGGGIARLVLTAFFLGVGVAHPATAFDFLEDTFLLDVRVGSNRSSAAQGLRNGAYELADGTQVAFWNWYSPNIPELSMIVLTQVSADFGIIWGLSTGEKAPKYRIDPALHMGFVYQTHPFDGATLSVKVTYPVGGRLRESACVADYGDIMGVVPVNCRLAAGLLPPEETLKHLLRLDGRHDARISVDFVIRF
ncbi:hypothetical protein NHN26_14335 [Rhodovulum tesquicola]|uniref:hypothetical protein n=1 Tax=Rhodovulum tesquicola TaxID=540254 RepID=UPI002097D0DA|nr:hypothetical protein [Rhodovulum tesquicola]MCO8146403.1 hypothetical protein [Rhodovulum tesquicola]